MDITASVKKIGRIWNSQRNSEIHAAVKEHMIPALAHLERELKAAAPVASGKTADSIVAQPWPSGYGGKVVSTQWQSIPIDSGAKAGFHAVEPLVEWVEIKLGISGLEGVRVANAIAYDHSLLGISSKNWWWATYQRTRTTLNRQYLKPIGASIKKKLVSGSETKTEKLV